MAEPFENEEDLSKFESEQVEPNEDADVVDLNEMFDQIDAMNSVIEEDAETIDALEYEIDQLEDENNELNAENAQLQVRLAWASERIYNRTQDVSAYRDDCVCLQNEINRLQARLDATWSQRLITFLGG